MSLSDDDITSKMCLAYFTEVCSMPQQSLLMSIQSCWPHTENLLNKSFMQPHPQIHLSIKELPFYFNCADQHFNEPSAYPSKC